MHRPAGRRVGLALKPGTCRCADRADGLVGDLPSFPRSRRMTLALLRKLLRDFRWPLLGVAIFLAGFECLWVKITQRITAQLVPLLLALARASKITAGDLETTLFEGPGKIMRTLMGGESINLDRAMDMLSIGYVHPTVQVVICIWAIGRSAGAIAGEIDRGTMELLMAQPLYR